MAINSNTDTEPRVVIITRASLASLGDIDNDGCDDLAVGAPFERDGRGAVHIFFGKRTIPSIQGLNSPC